MADQMPGAFAGVIPGFLTSRNGTTEACTGAAPKGKGVDTPYSCTYNRLHAKQERSSVAGPEVDPLSP